MRRSSVLIVKRLLALSVIALAGGRALHACQCSRPADPVAAGLQSAKAVFEGKVVERRLVFGSENGWLFPVPEYRFQVSRAWKGVSSPSLRLLGGYSNCATVFRPGEPYLVYAGKHWEVPDRLSSSKCDPTKPLPIASADFAVLGPPPRSFPAAEARLDGGSRLRAYSIGGLAAYANLLRHPDKRLAWIDTGPLSLSLLAAAILLLVIGVAIRPRRRIAGFLLPLVPLLLVTAVLAAGEVVFRNTWFLQYLE